MADTNNPFLLFSEWFEEAKKSEQKEPTAMALATSSASGVPSCRMVLLKDADERGFVFYTNLGSRKGQDLLENPETALCFYWPAIDRQVRVEGRAEPVSAEEADAYFASRPRLSRIGAWASKQSRPLAGMGELMTAVATETARFAIGEVPRPPHWSGFRVVPRRIEFWREGEFRLHERRVFTLTEAGWRLGRLYP